MALNSKQKRSRLTVMVILAAAVTGLFLVSIGRSDERAVVLTQTTATAQQLPSSDSGAVASTEYQPMTGKSAAAVSLVKMLVALAVVIVCIYVGIFLLKKLMAKRHTGRGGSNLLEVIETAYIDPKKSLSLVRVANKSVLIGVTDNQISVLTELDPQHTQTVIQQSLQHRSDDGFVAMLKSASNKIRGLGTHRDQSEG